MKRVLSIGAGLLALWLSPSFAQARDGKVFFHDGKWMKGDIAEQTEESGRRLVVVALKAGSMTIPREDVARIVYHGAPAKPDLASAKFHAALKNTPAKPLPEKRLNRNTPYSSFIREASRRHRLDPDLVRAVIKQESNFSHRDVSHKGAVGLMQLMPGTADGLGVQDAYDPYRRWELKYLRLMINQFGGDVHKALAAYNAGPGAVRRYGRIPPYRETQNYVRRVLRYYALYRGNQIVSFRDKDGRLIITDGSYVSQK